MLEAGKAPVTVNDALKILKLLCRYAVTTGSLRQLSFRVEFIRVQRKPRPTVPAHRLQEFLAAVDKEARNPHVAAIIRVMIGLGLREAEALGLRWDWLDLQQNLYCVGKSKSKTTRILPVPGWLMDTLNRIPRTHSPWVFPADDGLPHRSQFCRKALQRVCKKLDLGSISAHRLRASYASLHAEVAGTPITEIMGLMGHRSVQTTMLYIDTSLAAKRRAQDVLSQKLGLA